MPEEQGYELVNVDSEGNVINEQPALDEQQAPESFAGQALRVGTGALASAVSGLGGIPGQIEKFGRAVTPSVEKITGIPFKERTDLPENIRNIYAEQEKRFREGQTLPLAEDIKGAIGKVLPKDYLAPRGESEELIHNIAETAGELLFPLGGGSVKAAPIAQRIAKMFGVSAAGNISEFLTKKIGKEEYAPAVKLGTMFLAHAGASKFFDNRLDRLQGVIDQAVESPRTVSTKPIQEATTSIRKKFINVGLSTPAKKLIDGELDKIEFLFGRPRISLKDARASRADISEAFGEASRLPGSSGKLAKQKLTELRKAVDSAVKESADLPSFYKKAFNEYDELYSGLKQSQEAKRFINESIGRVAKNKISIIGALYSPATAVKAAIGVGGLKIAQPIYTFAKQLFTKPAIFNNYARMLTAAVNENKSEVIKYATTLNHQLKKSDEYPSAGYDLVDIPKDWM